MPIQPVLHAYGTRDGIVTVRQADPEDGQQERGRCEGEHRPAPLAQRFPNAIQESAPMGAHRIAALPAVQVVGKLRRAGVAALRILVETLEDDRFQVGGKVEA